MLTLHELPGKTDALLHAGRRSCRTHAYHDMYLNVRTYVYNYQLGK